MRCLIPALLALSACGGMVRPRSIDYGLLADLNDSTALLVVEGAPGEFDANCSGVWIGDKELLTAAHCVDGKHAEVSFLSFRETLAPVDGKPISSASYGRVVAFDEDRDLALIEAYEEGEHSSVSLAVLPPVQGDSVHVVGATAGEPWSYSPGTITAIRVHEFEGRDMFVIQVFSAAAPGNSGGPLFDSDGRLIGICSHGHVFNTGSFVHLNVIRSFLES